MESYGAILKKNREARGLDFDAVSKETDIKIEYLKAIEAENTNLFQDIGKTYFVGFLRNYADFLGVDVEYITKLYHSKELQEKTIPIDLFKKRKIRFSIFLIIFASIVVAAAATFGIFKLVRFLIDKKAQTEVFGKNALPKTYELSDKPQTMRIYIGDKISVPSQNGNIILTVSETLNSLALETPVGVQFVDLSEELEMDCDGDGKSDIIVYLSDISNKNAENGAEVRLLLRSGQGILSDVDVSAIPYIDDVPKSATQSIVFEDSRAYPFTLSVSFRAGSLFRYKVDRHDLVEDYYSNGDLITMTANNGVRIWIGNGNVAKIQVIANAKTYDLPVAKGGQVVAQDIKWIRDSDGKYKVAVIELD